METGVCSYVGFVMLALIWMFACHFQMDFFLETACKKYAQKKNYQKKFILGLHFAILFLYILYLPQYNMQGNKNYTNHHFALYSKI